MCCSGDGECAEGAVWEAASLAGIYKLNNLVAIVDVNRLGQSQATAFGHDLDVYKKRFEAFGWRTEEIDGHDLEEILEVLAAVGLGDQPLVILAKTLKGAGVSFLQDKDGWHGKPLSKEEAAPRDRRTAAHRQVRHRRAHSRARASCRRRTTRRPPAIRRPTYKLGDMVATREAYGNALVRIGEVDPRVVAMDGDTKNSTYLGEVLQEVPGPLHGMLHRRAEHGRRGHRVSARAARCRLPPPSPAFFTRAYDQIRVAGISMANLKLVGSHVGVSIGEDGPSQMGLEDLAMMRAVAGSTVLYPSDAVCAEKLVEQMAAHKGICFLRTSRPKTPVIYSNDEAFPIGGAKVLRQSAEDKVTVVAAGVTLFEALKAADALKGRGHRHHGH